MGELSKGYVRCQRINPRILLSTRNVCQYEWLQVKNFKYYVEFNDLTKVTKGYIDLIVKKVRTLVFQVCKPGLSVSLLMTDIFRIVF